jgi:hypothetical protein
MRSRRANDATFFQHSAKLHSWRFASGIPGAGQPIGHPDLLLVSSFSSTIE